MEFLDEIGIFYSMWNIMLDDWLGKCFVKKEMFILGGIIDLEKVKYWYIIVIVDIGEKVLVNCF